MADQAALVQSYIDSTGVVPPGSYEVAQNLFARSNMVLDLTGVTIFRSPTTTWNASQFPILIVVQDVHDVEIRNGTLIGSLSFNSTGADFGIDIERSQRIWVHGAQISQMAGATLAGGPAGDAIYIGGSGVPSSDITVTDCLAQHCVRQFVSVVHGNRVLIARNKAEHISGTDPGAGVDFEPNTGQFVDNCWVEWNFFYDCQRGVLFAYFPPTDALIRVRNNGYNGASMRNGAFIDSPNGRPVVTASNTDLGGVTDWSPTYPSPLSSDTYPALPVIPSAPSLGPPPATAPVTQRTLDANFATSTANAVSTASVTPVAGRHVYLGICYRNYPTAVSPAPTVTGNGLSWSLLDLMDCSADSAGAVDHRLALYEADTGSSPSGGPATITFNTGQKQVNWIYVEFADSRGVPRSHLPVSDAQAWNTQTIRVDFETPFTSSGNAVFAVMVRRYKPDEALTAGGGLTFITDCGGGTDMRMMAEWGASPTTAPTAGTATGFDGSDGFVMAAIAVEVGQSQPTATLSFPFHVTATVAGPPAPFAIAAPPMVRSGPGLSQSPNPTYLRSALRQAVAGSSNVGATVSFPLSVHATATTGGVIPTHGLTYAPVAVQLGLGSGPLTDLTAITWTDVSLYAQEVDITRGRQHELNRFQAGTARVLFTSHDGRFLSTNTASPYAPNLVPMTPIRIMPTWTNGIAYPLFLGYVDAFPATSPNPVEATVEVTATDLFKTLNLAQLGASPWATEVIHSRPQVWLRMGDTGDVAVDSSGHGFDGSYQMASGAIAQGIKGLVAGDADGAADFAHSAGQRILVPYPDLIPGYPFSVECIFQAVQNRTEQRMFFAAYDAPTPPTNGVELLIDTNGAIGFAIFAGSSNFQAETTTAWDDGKVHHLLVTVPGPGQVTFYVDNVAQPATLVGSSPWPTVPLVSGYSVGNTPSVGFGDFGFGDANNFNGGLDEFAIYLRDLSPSINERSGHFYASQGFADTTINLRMFWMLDTLGVAPADPGILNQFSFEGSISGSSESMAPGGPANGSMLAYFQALEQTEDGAFFIAGNGAPTFYNRYHWLTGPGKTSLATFGTRPDLGELVYEGPVVWGDDDLDIWNEVSITRVQNTTDANAPQPMIVGNQASQAQYGKRTLELTGLWMGSDEEAIDLANALLSRYEWPVNRIRQLTFQAQDDPANLYPQLLGRELRDRCSVVLRSPGGAPTFTQDVLIEGISHQIRQGVHRTTYSFSLFPSVSPSNSSLSFLIFDDPVSGRFDSNAFAY